jgi:hypothetical protein
MSTTQTATRTMDVINRCVCTLHDLAAESPQAAAETVAAIRALDTPAAYSTANLVRRVAEARHGEDAVRRAEMK